MSKDQQQLHHDDLDLLVIFNYIGERFNKLFALIGRILDFVFRLFIYACRAILKNIKIVVGTLIISAILGYVLEANKEPIYESKMLVRTYFDAKFQLASNLEYYNSLLGDENYELLGSIFELEPEKITDIKFFELSTGPETDNEKFAKYDEFLKSLDSLRAKEISFEEYIENRNIFSGSVFEIRVESKNKHGFKILENGIYKSFNNLYSIEKKRQRDSMLGLRRQNILTSIAEIDSLQNVYINVLEEESKSTKTRISLGEGFPLQQEKSDTKEYQLLNKEIELMNQLNLLEEEKIEESELFEVVATFQELGNSVRSNYDRYTIVLPLLAFLLLSLVYFARKFANYVMNYDR